MKQISQYKWISLAVLLWILLVGATQINYKGQNLAIVQQVQILHCKNITSEYNNQDQQITQELTVKLITGRFRHHHYVLHNTYYQSQATSDQYRTHSIVLLSSGRHLNQLSLIGPKRDNVLLIMVGVIIFNLVVLLHLHGLRAILSAIVNCALFGGLLRIATQWQNQHILLLTITLVIIATPVTLAIIFGYSRQTVIATLATLASVFLSLGMGVIVLQLTNSQGLHYETLDYGIQPFKLVFLAETLLGVLGTCMDETTDITASVYQLLQENPSVTMQQLFKSGLTVGQEIIGPLINILFYLFLAEIIPLVVLYLRNGNTLQFALSRTMTLGYTQTVISAIGIVLAVPLTSALAAKLLRGEHA